MIKKIIVMPTDPNKGEGAMKGEILITPVRITKVSRVAIAPPAPASTPAPTPSPG